MTVHLSISLIIPAYNEAALLPRLLDSVDAARRAYRGGPDAVEVVVADNASSDATAAIAAARGCHVAPAPVRGIAVARNAGAAVARGRILAFVDADSQVHRETFNVVAALMERPEVVGGATGVTMERWSLGIALAYAVVVPLVRLAGMDTGVVFCRRADFEVIGGYDESLRFAEDVRFLWDLRRLGWRRGARLVRATAAKAVTSTRKFDEFGEWHYLVMLAKAPWYLLRRRAGDRFADRYWYDVRR